MFVSCLPKKKKHIETQKLVKIKVTLKYFLKKMISAKATIIYLLTLSNLRSKLEKKNNNIKISKIVTSGHSKTQVKIKNYVFKKYVFILLSFVKFSIQA